MSLDWPQSEFDPTCSADANTQHFMHMLEGYRAFVMGGEYGDSPYSPGSARDFSWLAGFSKAKEDSWVRSTKDRA